MEHADPGALALALLFGAGLVAGFVNVVAGGGSLLTLPVLLFAGLPAPVANASNRIGLVAQNIVASGTFARGGRLPLGLSLRLAIPALPGAVLGAWLAVDIDERLFRLVLAGVMVVVLVAILRGAGQAREARPGTPAWVLAASFFAMGFYAGFLQAGLGFLLIAALTGLVGLGLVESNAVKVTVVLVLQLAALAFFQSRGTVDWTAGGCLAAGMLLGGGAGARWQMAVDPLWVRRALVVLTLLFALRLVAGAFSPGDAP